MTSSDAAPGRAAELYAAGLAANEDMNPVEGARALRAALQALGPTGIDGG